MNSNGWLRIVEASLAILIILSVLFVLYQRGTVMPQSDLTGRAQAVLSELSTDPSFREAVLLERTEEVKQAVIAKIPDLHNTFDVRICDVDDVCGKTTFTDGNVYVAERVISSSVGLSPENGGARPKKIKLFLWREA